MSEGNETDPLTELIMLLVFGAIAAFLNIMHMDGTGSRDLVISPKREARQVRRYRDEGRSEIAAIERQTKRQLRAASKRAVQAFQSAVDEAKASTPNGEE